MFSCLVSPVQAYFKKTRRYSRLRFVVELALVPFPIKMFLAIVWAIFGQNTQSTTEVIDKGNPIELTILACIVAPLVETVIGQWFPIWVTSFFTKNLPILLSVSSIFFAIQHLHVGFSGILIALPPGIFLSWSFLVKRERSKWEAYWVTSAIHSLHNLIALAFYYSIKGF